MFHIVAGRFNAQYVDGLVHHVVEELRALASNATIALHRVPGSFEIPVVAAALAREIPPYAAIICFGAILKGATTHADHIALGVTHALANLQISTGIPIIHGVLQFDNEEQAKVRCLGTEHNRGTEAARVALSMAEVMKSLSTTAPS